MKISNISSEATGLNVTNFYVEPSGAEGTKSCPKDSGHMPNMAAMPVESINLFKCSSVEPMDTKSFENRYVASST